MYVSNRHRQILELLLNRSEEITAGEIAAEIKVSVRTVHRELAELEDILAAQSVTLQKKSGKGIQLQASSDQLETLRQQLFAGTAVDYSAEDRKVLILCMLLQADEPVKLFSLAHHSRVTVPTVTHDLDELESWIEQNKLTLVRRRGYGVEISGPEIQMRHMIGLLARNHLDESDLFGHNGGLHRSSVKQQLLHLIGKENVMKVEAALWQAESEWLNKLTESDYTDLLVRLSATITRIRLGKLIEEDSGLQPEAYRAPLLPIIERLSAAFQVAFSSYEIAYLGWLLESKDLSNPDQLLSQGELSCMEIAGRLIRFMEDQTELRFTGDRSLLEGLVSHMESALQRIQAGYHIRNPLLAQIKKDYAALFIAVRTAVNATMHGIGVPDEEIGYLVMHFGASMERLKQFGRNVRAIIVCTSGIGSSKLLAVRLNKEFPQIDIMGHASWYEAARIPEEEYDLIISTIELPIDSSQYIKLSPLLTEEESDRLRTFIQDVTLKQKPSVRAEVPESSESLERLFRLQKYLNEIVTIVDQFRIHPIEEPFSSLRDILMLACDYVQRTGALNHIEAVVELLIARQKQSSQVIPDTGIALFHTRSEQIGKPSLTLFRLKEDMPLGADSESGVRQLLLMLAPRELSRESLEVLSEISSFLLIPDMVSLLESGSEDEVRQYLSKELTLFFESIYQTDKRRSIR